MVTENSQLCVLGKRSSQSKLFQNVLPSPTSANRPFIKLTVFPSAKLPMLAENAELSRGNFQKQTFDPGILHAGAGMFVKIYSGFGGNRF